MGNYRIGRALSQSKAQLVLWLLLFCFVSRALSQTPPHWRYWLAKDGLRESCSNSIVLSKSGKVYVNHGHVDEMSVLDGYGITHIPSPSFGAPVCEDADGQLWSLNDQGFLTLNPEQSKPAWTRHPVKPFWGNWPFYPINKTKVLFHDYFNRLALRIVDASETVVLREMGTLGRINDIYVDSSRTVWVAGMKGMAEARLDRSGKSLASWTEHRFPNELPFSNLQMITPAPDGALYIVAYHETRIKNVLLEFRDRQWKVLTDDPSSSVIGGWQGLNNSLWLILSPFDIHHLSGNRVETVERNRVLSRIKLDQALESNGAFWLATSEGLARYAPAAWRTPEPLEHLKTVAHGIKEDGQGRLWFVYSDRLVMLQGDEWQFYPLPEGEQTDELTTESIAILPDGNVLLKTSLHVLRFDPETETYTQFSPTGAGVVHAFATRPQGGIWAISRTNATMELREYDGLQSHILANETLQNNYLNESVRIENAFQNLNPFIRHIYRHSSGAFLIGGLQGLILYQNYRFRKITAEDGFTDTAAYCIQAIDLDRVWVGGRDAIHEWNGQTWRRIISGLDGVRCILPARDGSVWVASGTGLHRYKDGSWVTHTADEGLPDASVYEIYEDSHKRFWCGTTSGLSLYHPEADADAPETFIPAELNSSTVTESGGQFVARGIDKWNYTQPERLLYSHCVDEREWSPFISEPVISINDISAGEHRLSVRCMDRNWNIDTIPAFYAFTVLLPWYKDPTVLAILSIITVALVISLWVHLRRHRDLGRLVSERTQDLMQANRQLQQDAQDLSAAYNQVLSYQNQIRKLAAELSQVEERERRQMASDLHDGIGQTLALSVIKLEALQDALDTHPQSSELEKVKELIERTLQSTRSLTLELCPPLLYEVGLEAAIEQVIEQIHNQHGVKVETSFHLDGRKIPDGLMYFLFRAIRELLLNVVKHAKTDAAELLVEVDGDTLMAQVKDNGEGIDPGRMSMSHRRFGLFSIRERLNQIGGEFQIEGESGRGTIATIKVNMNPTASMKGEK